MSLVGRIDEIIERHSLLKHPFYRMWSAGDLTLESLSGYAKEYYQLVRAVPDMMSPIIERAPGHLVEELSANQREESEHIVPWTEFAAALGVDGEALGNYAGLPKTIQAVEDLSGLTGSFESGACAMYAFEKEIPEISRTKLEGLEAFYGITDSRAVRYFELHTEADVRHAASWRGVLEAAESDPEDLLGVAGASVAAQNLLLDGCYEAYCQL